MSQKTLTEDTRSGAGETQSASSKRWWILAIVAIAQLMVVLDATIVNIALPSAQKDLGFSDGNRQWIVTAYALAFASLLLLGGRIADLFGRKTAFLAGVVGFAAASALGGAATSFEMLVTARALQGVAGALLARPRCPCSTRPSPTPVSAPGPSASTAPSPAQAARWVCCSAVC